ncbi:unnamed protein product [Ostreobium quekettii]|uniref:Kinesin-like protein n=1 Tax=Ostreobium quekettii TaxID=121088 RepID=A0A8S1IMR8_9CHLO|nr:unnamed protein product [Ostreobium quekettii]|eukprot:evm.model.scf_659EXC.1 EVM.evm.TU.scf_659EXC.1   scf_659EXC:6876-18553(+)
MPSDGEGEVAVARWSQDGVSMAPREPTEVEVAVRVKPADGNERDCSVTVAPGDQGCSLLVRAGSRTDAGTVHKYCFPHVFESEGQEDVYEACARTLVSSVSKGYNASILAYGHTGSGKTYTMIGPDKTFTPYNSGQGIIPRAVCQVFADLGESGNWSVSVTFVEIHNETIADLLHPDQKDISVMDTSCKSNYVAGGYMTFRNIELESASSAEEALGYLEKGVSQLHGSENATANLHSARSHTIFTLWIENEIDGKTCHSKLNMVDLAGSERLWKMNPKTGALLKEAAFLNRSVGVLSMVAKELKRKMPYVPFGDCKVTHYLKDAIGGNCRTLLIACVFRDESHLRDTQSTCRFAEDLGQIRIHPQRFNVPGSDTSQATLFRADPLTMRCMEKMSELRASQQMQRYLRARSRKREKHAKAIRALQKPPEEQRIEPSHEWSQELQDLRNQVQEFERRQRVWEEKHVGSTQQELRLLQGKVQDLETKLSKGSGSSRSGGKHAESSGAWDRSMESEVHRLQEKVEQLDKACYSREQELEELNHLRKHVLNRQLPHRMPSYQAFAGMHDSGGMTPGPGMQRLVAVQPMSMGGMHGGASMHMMPGMHPMGMGGMSMPGLQGMGGMAGMGGMRGMAGMSHMPMGPSSMGMHRSMHPGMHPGMKGRMQGGMQGGNNGGVQGSMHGMQQSHFVHGMGDCMNPMASMQMPFAWQEEGVETPDTVDGHGTRGPFASFPGGQGGQWDGSAPMGSDRSDLRGTSSNHQNDLLTEAQGYLMDPDSTDSAWQQYLPPDPRLHLGNTPPLHPQQRFVGMAPGLQRTESGYGASSPQYSGEGGSSPRRTTKNKQKKREGFVKKVSRMFGIGTQSQSECQDDEDVALSFSDTFDEHDHTQVREGWVQVPTQNLAPGRSHPISSSGYANYPEPTSLFLDSDTSSQLMMNEDGVRYGSSSQPTRAHDLPRLDLQRVRH